MMRNVHNRINLHANVAGHGDMRTSVRFAHDSDDGDLSTLSTLNSVSIERRTPLAVRIGRAFSFGSSAFLYSSGIALMMSTRRGTPPNPNFLLIFALSSFSETIWFASWAFMSSAAIPEVTRSKISACDGPIEKSKSASLTIGICAPSVCVLCTILPHHSQVNSRQRLALAMLGSSSRTARI